MADYITVTTDFTTATGAAFSGYLIATMMAAVVTNAAGAKDYVAPFRKKFTVTNGAAQSLALPVTEDSNPSGVPVILELYDDLGHLHQVVELVTPRIGAVGDAQQTIALKDYL